MWMWCGDVRWGVERALVKRGSGGTGRRRQKPCPDALTKEVRGA